MGLLSEGPIRNAAPFRRYMFIYPVPIGYDEETGNCYVNPESVDAMLIAWLKKGLSAEEAYKQLDAIIREFAAAG
jgi:hypothetical protein